MRAERNRQSAAASRERKKQHTKDLEQEVCELSKQNATLVVKQLNTLEERIQSEQKLEDENATLRQKVKEKKARIDALSNELKNLTLGLEPSPAVRKLNTWDNGELGKKITGLGSDNHKTTFSCSDR